MSDTPLLVDTSAWVEYLRGTGSRAHLEVRRLVRDEPQRLCVTEPVAMELLAVAGSGPALEKLERLTAGMRQLTIDPAVDFHAAATAYRAARTAGRTVRKLLDCIIAAVALRTGATLVHRDQDFDVLAEVLPELSVVSLRGDLS
ncbi:MAG: PIN domain nuclease [Pseudonocardiaceae bacterium]|nr:MAG: PIN domain nuclease [Pseudonocardiaceae bacterium]